MTTVQQIFDMAIHLMDEQNESNGATGTVDTSEYKYRTVSILNSIIPRLYIYSSNYEDDGTGRTAPEQLKAGDYAKPDLTQEIPLDDVLSLSLLPYYLAAQLLSAENESLSAWFLNMYRENLNDIRNKVKADFEAISTPYGLF